MKTGLPKVLTPIAIAEVVASPDLPKGTVLVVEVLPCGTEKGNGFTIGEKTYDKIFANNPKFKLKKKAQ